MDDIKIVEIDDVVFLDEIVLIHCEAFPDFFLTQLGKRFLKLLYRGYIEDNDSGIIIAKSCIDNKIVGFIAYSNDYSRFYSELLKKHLIRFAFYSLLAALNNPSFIKRLLGALKKSDEVKRCEKYVELASIGVKKNSQGKGIGLKLIKFFINSINFNEYEYINLETDAINNDYVNNFYQNVGFKLYREYITKEGRKMNEYRFSDKEHSCDS